MASNESNDNRALCKEVRELLLAHGVKQIDGPGMAYFETADGHRIVYVSHPNGIPGNDNRFFPTPQAAIAATLDNLRATIQPNKTLVWREIPQIEVRESGGFRTYMRFAQLPNDVDHIDIRHQAY